ncbi:hypothetical protein L0F63_003816, partial [Massospora cicadina]
VNTNADSHINDQTLALTPIQGLEGVEKIFHSHPFPLLNPEQHLSAPTPLIVDLAFIAASAATGPAHQQDLERPLQGKLSPNTSQGSYHTSTYIFNHVVASVPSLAGVQATVSESEGQ